MDFKKLEDFMDHLTSWRIPGCACRVYMNGEKVFSYASGYADVENKIKMDAEHHRMFMYSISKIITCATALSLWEEGRFTLNDPVSRYLPKWSDMKVKERDCDGNEIIVSAKREITVGDLFTMTSGLDYNCDSPSMTAARNATAPHCDTMTIMNALAAEPLNFHPGERWCYGLSHDVLGAVIEAISGKTLGELAKERIFDPLGLEKTAYGLDEAYRDEMAVQYCYNDEKGCFEKNWSQDNWAIFGDRYCSGGAGVVSTVDEIAKIMSVLANKGKLPSGKRILASRTVDLMRSPFLSSNQVKSLDWGHLKGYNYGLGVRTMYDPMGGGSSSPKGEFGWTGAAGGVAIIDPDNKLALFYAHHMINNQEDYVLPRIRNVLYSCIDE